MQKKIIIRLHFFLLGLNLKYKKPESELDLLSNLLISELELSSEVHPLGIHEQNQEGQEVIWFMNFERIDFRIVAVSFERMHEVHISGPIGIALAQA